MADSLPRVSPGDVRGATARPPVDQQTLSAASTIVDDVRARGVDALRDHAERFGERTRDEALVLDREAMARATRELDAEDRGVLERAADRIRAFAEAQRDAIKTLRVPVPGGEAGHTVEPVDSAGCYAPAGRYPLVSSVLMTAITARAAGCRRVVVASPGAHPAVLAAASIAGADELLAAGGAHAIAALGYGVDGLDRCDVIAGPGNRWVTAAKQLVAGIVGIDMLAGPSELLVLADDEADASLVAADLLAQAEHDADAVPILVTTSGALADGVDEEIRRQLDSLPTRDVASSSLSNGFCCVVDTVDEMIELADRIAPEHLEILTRDAPGVAERLRHAGALFIGPMSAEVLGDYGAGPNHTLPTGGTARFQAGLSVMHFLRLRTWLRIDAPDDGLLADTRHLATMEGLAGHAVSAARRAAGDRGS